MTALLADTETVQDCQIRLVKLELELTKLEYRKACQKSFLAFVRHMEPTFHQAWFHLQLIDVLQRVGDGELKRVIISMPPRHAKTTFSRLFTAWFLGRRPSLKIIGTSYSDEIASDSNRAVQEIMDSNRYKEIFPKIFLPTSNVRTVASRKLRNNSIFELENNTGSYYSAGIMGGITGKGATGGIIIDDPTKNYQAASSESIKTGLEQEWKFTIRSRAEDGAFIILIMTRWLADDFAGQRLLEAENNPDADQWTEINFAAVQDDALDDTDPRALGDTLWPENGYDKKWAKATAATIGPDAWQSQYQQRPTVVGGGILKTFNFKFWYYPGTEPSPIKLPNNKGELVEIEQIPIPGHFANVLQSWDMTFKKTTAGSFIVGQVWGYRCPSMPSMSFLIDQVRARGDFDDAIGMVRGLSAKWPIARKVLIEDKANGSAIQSHLKREIAGINMVLPVGDKVERAHNIAPNLNAGNLVIPHPSLYSWVKGFLNEISGFPKSKHDDQVDTMTQAVSDIYGKGTWKVH
jgi:predicted phage terminase large subunit-like protein